MSALKTNEKSGTSHPFASAMRVIKDFYRSLKEFMKTHSVAGKHALTAVVKTGEKIFADTIHFCSAKDPRLRHGHYPPSSLPFNKCEEYFAICVGSMIFRRLVL